MHVYLLVLLLLLLFYFYYGYIILEDNQITQISSTLKWLIKYVHVTLILPSFNHKNFFRAMWSVNFFKKFLFFLYFDMITNFEFRIFIICFYSKAHMGDWLYMKRPNFGFALICIVLLLNISATSATSSTFFDIYVTYL